VPARCVSHNGKTFVVYQRVKVFLACGKRGFSKISLKYLWEGSGVSCNVVQPNSRRREVDWASVYWCALGPPARKFRRGLGITTLQSISSPTDSFTKKPTFGLVGKYSCASFELTAYSDTAEVLCVQVVVVCSFISIYACGSRIRVGCSRHPLFRALVTTATPCRPARGAWQPGEVSCVPSWARSVYDPRSLAWNSAGAPCCWCQQAGPQWHLHVFRSCVVDPLWVLQGVSASGSLTVGYPQLTRWSVDELVVLFTLQTGVPACYGLRRTSSWCDMMDVCGSQNVTDMLLVRTLCVYDKRPWNMSAITSGADKDNDMEKGTPPVAVSRWYTRVQTYTSICIYFVLL